MLSTAVNKPHKDQEILRTCAIIVAIIVDFPICISDKAIDINKPDRKKAICASCT